MGRRLNSEDKLKIYKLLKSGLTSDQCAREMGVSAPTINNLRAKFKKTGEIFPNNQGRKSVIKDNSHKLTKTHETEDSSYGTPTYSYLINGIRIEFTEKPKTVRIGKNRFFVEFD